MLTIQNPKSKIQNPFGRVTGFVLAGGKSSRMGCDKAWLPLGPYSLVECVIERIRPHVERVVVIGNAGNIRELGGLSVDGVLVDCQTGYGPLMGLYTGLMHSQTPWNLFVSCDMPCLESWAIERLLQARRDEIDLAAFQVKSHGHGRGILLRRPSPEELPAVPPSRQQAGWPPGVVSYSPVGFPNQEISRSEISVEPARLQPFPLVCHTRAAVHIGRLLDHKQLALQALMGLPATEWLELDANTARLMLRNVNSMADYHALCVNFAKRNLLDGETTKRE